MLGQKERIPGSGNSHCTVSKAPAWTRWERDVTKPNRIQWREWVLLLGQEGLGSNLGSAAAQLCELGQVT